MGRSVSVVPAVLEVTGRATPSHLVSQRKSSMEGLSKGRLSCCSLTSWKNQAEECDEIYINALGLLFSYCFSCSQAASIAPWHLCMWLVTLVVTTLSAAAYLQDWDDNSHLAPLVQTSQAWGCFSLPFSLKQRESSPVKSQIVCVVLVFLFQRT